MRAVLKAFLLLVAVLAVSLVVTFVWIASRGISARAEPGAIETAVARTMRRLAIPRGDRNRQNPIKIHARSPRRRNGPLRRSLRGLPRQRRERRNASGSRPLPEPPDGNRRHSRCQIASCSTSLRTECG